MVPLTRRPLRALFYFTSSPLSLPMHPSTISQINSATVLKYRKLEEEYYKMLRAQELDIETNLKKTREN